jgi:hypothetical protein
MRLLQETEGKGASSKLKENADVSVNSATTLTPLVHGALSGIYLAVLNS